MYPRIWLLPAIRCGAHPAKQKAAMRSLTRYSWWGGGLTGTELFLSPWDQWLLGNWDMLLAGAMPEIPDE